MANFRFEEVEQVALPSHFGTAIAGMIFGGIVVVGGLMAAT